MSSQTSSSTSDSTSITDNEAPSTTATSIAADEPEEKNLETNTIKDDEDDDKEAPEGIEASGLDLDDDISEDSSKSKTVRRLLRGAITIAAEHDAEKIGDLRNDLGDEIIYKALAKRLSERKEDATKRNLQALSFLLLVEDRMIELEDQIKKIQAIQNSNKTSGENDKEGKDDSTDIESQPRVETRASLQAKLVTTPKLMDWSEFVNPSYEEIDQPDHVLDILTQRPRPLPSRAVRERQKASQHRGPAMDDFNSLESDDVERVRINSDALNELIANTIGLEEPPKTHQVHVRPFKFLFASEGELHSKLEELKLKDSTDAQGKEVKQEKAPETKLENAELGENSEKSEAAEETSVPYGENLTAHLQCLLNFMDDILKPEIQARRQLRDRTIPPGGPTIEFRHLWHLFSPGDTVFDPIARQAYQVLMVTGGRRLLGRATDKESEELEEEKDQEPNLTMGTEDDAITPMTVTCFHFDFDGKNYGPVQRAVRIPPFDIARSIRSLPVFPIEYADEKHAQGEANHLAHVAAEFNGPRTSVDDNARPEAVKAISASLDERGQKFADLTSTNEVAHKEYDGFSLDDVREQIDSQIIIDLGLFYEKFPKKIPDLGLSEPEEGRSREVQESYHLPCYCADITCTRTTLEKHGEVFDDRIIDKASMAKFKSQKPGLFGARRDKLERDCRYLLPRKVHGFVLRSRTWCALDVEKISEFHSRKESFKQLVLPDKHKTIVEGLVKSHAGGPKPAKDVQGEALNDRQEDLVRGKGKGLIILLHGVPGVGKTSTAECVAEYTGRPLFALTCGDIGDNAASVQSNLTETFQLAHRWGCVMLLDEADVFLQQRDRQNMQRNAIVSVFLRILEYYSGILFLTTNKVGTFDEAFKSRIHISLYYQSLDKHRSKEIWKVNFDRLRKTRPDLKFDEEDLINWVKKSWKEQTKAKGLRPWNGRQIHNACQTAAALADFQSGGHLTSQHLEDVAETTREFDKYLKSTHGNRDDMDRAQAAQDRGDDAFLTPKASEKRSSKASSKSTSKKSKSSKKEATSESEEEDGDEAKNQASESDSDSD